MMELAISFARMVLGAIKGKRTRRRVAEIEFLNRTLEMKAAVCLLLLALAMTLEAIPVHPKMSEVVRENRVEMTKAEEGDMLFTKEQLQNLKDTTGRMKRRANDISRWPEGRVVYEIVDIGSDLIKLVKKAFQQWSAKTCLVFDEFDGIDANQPRIQFVHSAEQRCLSYVGYTGGVQQIWLSSKGCSYLGVLLHEIGHAIGMLHEHNRIDRDKYVTVNYDNIKAGYSSQFDIINTPSDTSVPYDVGSIMHYGPFVFSTVPNNEDFYTIEAHDPEKQRIMGRQEGLSHIDSMFVNNIYSCNVHCSNAELAQDCKNGGFVGKDCVCVCPDGIVGDLCQSLASSKTSSNCGGHFTDDKGEISSPNFPKKYPLNTQCYYLIEAPEGYTVELTFDSFSIEEDSFCYWDQIFIRYDAPYFDTSAPAYCGRSLEGRTLTSQGNTIMLDFNSDDFSPETGFHATYSFGVMINELT